MKQRSVLTTIVGTVIECLLDSLESYHYYYYYYNKCNGLNTSDEK
jgi:hypothetical protein